MDRISWAFPYVPPGLYTQLSRTYLKRNYNYAGHQGQTKTGESASKSLRNQFRPPKLANVFLLRISKTQVAKVLQKELAKEEFPIGFEQCSHDLTCLCNLRMLSHTSPNCNLHFLNNVTYVSVEVISGMLAPGKCNITFSTSCQENVRLHFPGANLWKM